MKQYAGDLIFNTETDLSGFNQGVSAIGSGGSKILGHLKNVAIAGAALIATGIGVAAKAGISYNAQMEQYSASFETMLGSQAKATQHMADLKTMAAKTPFEMSDLAEASKTLMAFGVDVKDVEGYLQTLGDISQGNKERFNGLALVFGQVKSQGKLMGQDLLQMINSGFNPLQVISEKTGESMESLKDRMSKGKISFEEVADAMKTATSEGGKFYNAMEKQSTTMIGQWSTFKDNLNELLGKIMKPLSDFITNKLLPGAIHAIEFINNNLGKITPILAGITAAIASAFVLTKAIGAVNALTSAWKTAQLVLTMYNRALSMGLTKGIAAMSLQTKIIGLLTGQLKLATVAGGAFKAVMSFIANNKLIIIVSALIAIGTALAVASKNAGGLDNLFSGIANKISAFVSNIPAILAGVQNVFSSVFSSIAANLPAILSGIGNAILSVFSTIITNIPTILAGIGSALIGVSGAIIAALPGMLVQLATMLQTQLPYLITVGTQAIISFINGLESSLPLLIATGTEVIVQLITAFFTALPMIIETGITLLTTLIEAIISNLPMIIAMGIALIMALIQGLVENIPILIEGGIQLILGLINGLIQALPVLIAAIPQIITAIVTAISNNIVPIVNGAISIILALIQGLIQALPVLIAAIPQIIWAIVKALLSLTGALIQAGIQIIGAIISGIGSAIKGIVNIGRDIISGLWQGINDKWDWLIDKIKGFTNSVKDKLKDFFGIHSPSKWAKDVIGRMIARGIWLGFDGENPMDHIKDRLVAGTEFLKKGFAINAGLSFAGANNVEPAFASGTADFPGIKNNNDSVLGKLIDKIDGLNDREIKQEIHFHEKIETPADARDKLKEAGRHGLEVDK